MTKQKTRDSLLSGGEVLVTPDERAYHHPYEGGYHQREGYATSDPNQSKRSSWLYVPNSKWTWALTALTVTQAIVGLGLEGYVFGEFQVDLNDAARGKSEARTVPAYLSLFIFGFIYQLILVWDALRLKNTIQIIGLCLYNVGLLVEAGVQFDQIHDAVLSLATPVNGGSALLNEGYWGKIHPFMVAVPCIIGLITILMGFVAWKLYDEFAWSIYKHISADLKLRRMYLSYQVYIALLKFDFFFFLAFTVQFLVVVPSTPSFELYLTIVAIPVTVVVLILAGFWTRREIVAGMIGTLVVYFGGLAYFLYKLVRMYAKNSGRELDYRPARHSLTTFAVITILCLIATIVYACICTSNFKKGLGPHIGSNEERRGRPRGNSGELTPMYSGNHVLPVAEPGPSPRMTID